MILQIHQNLNYERGTESDFSNSTILILSIKREKLSVGVRCISLTPERQIIKINGVYGRFT